MFDWDVTLSEELDRDLDESLSKQVLLSSHSLHSDLEKLTSLGSSK